MADTLSWQAGKIDAPQVRAATPSLRSAIERSRRTPASLTVRRRLVGIERPVLSATDARVVATVRNDDTGVVYDVELLLVRTPAGWEVRSTR